MKMAITEFEREQIPKILELCRCSDVMPLDSYRYLPFTVEDFERVILQQGPFGELFDQKGFFLAFVDNDLAGFIRAHVSNVENEIIGLISPEWPWSLLSLVVNPRYQKKGVGTALLNRSLEYLLEKGAEVAQSSTDEKCVPRLRFLIKHGFEVWGKPHFIMGNSLSEPIPKPVLPEGYSFLEFSFGDEEEWVSACNRFFEGSAKPRPVSGFVNYYVKNPNFDPSGFIGVTYKGEIVGIIWNIVQKSYVKYSGKKTGFLEVLGVDKDHRNKGLGKALVLKSLLWHRSKGMENVDVMTDSDIAFRLYTQMWVPGHEHVEDTSKIALRFRMAYMNIQKKDFRDIYLILIRLSHGRVEAYFSNFLNAFFYDANLSKA